MKTSFLLKLTYNIIILSFISIFSCATDFYVSLEGVDSNSGTKDKPFATLERAKIAVQNSIQNTNEKDFTIWVADGFYEIETPIVFKSEYFNDKIEVFIKSIKNTSPVISGGKVLKNWTRNENGFWVADLPKNSNENWSPRELFINNKRAIRARHPNENYMRVKKVGKDRRTNFQFNKGDFPIPRNVNGVELVFLHDWSISRIGVKSIDSKKNRLTAVDSVGARSPAFFNLDNWEKDPRYFLENALEFLDADYEWFLDNKVGKIYLKLPENMNPQLAQIVVPFSESLIHIKGEENLPIKNIHFEGISFKHCSWEIPEFGYCGVQACYFDARPKSGWTEISPAIKVEWAENCTFDNCNFENIGGSGIWLGTGCKSCSIINSNLSDISANGIMVGEGRNRFIDGEVWWKHAPEQVALGNTIENCKVTKCGVQFFGAIGIWCGFTAETTIKNNEIADLPYSGISIGWEWSPAETPCRNNVIDGNHIHHIMNVLSDGGGIYMLGLQPGSKLINNQIHDVKINAGSAESNGMFLDEGTTNLFVANNLIYNIAKSPLRFHRATTNLIKDNYLFCTGDNPPIRYNRTNEEDIEKVGNKVFLEGDENYFKELKKAVRKWK
ncbi:MAG: hypothetical protein GQ525_02065 [Draconibacterium sp.]|nr:hypothetical protein [Draconibacterium sp.]